jgi:acetyl esterase/lipase
VLLIPALALCVIALWILLPPFQLPLVLLTMGAPELSPWLLLASSGVCALTFHAASVSPTGRAAFTLAAIAAMLFAYPIVRAPFALASFDRAMEQGLGRDYVDQIPAATRSTLRAHAVSPVDSVRGFARGDVVIRRGVEFAKPAGVPLTVDIYRPAAAGPHPVLVQIYGGAWQRGSPELSSSFASWFASRGYVVFAIDYRHAPEAKWPAQIEDVRVALGWILAHAGEYQADSSRIALIGRSAGAQLALVAAYQAGPSLVRAVVSYYGPTDLVEAWRTPPRPDPIDSRAVLETYLGDTPDRALLKYQEASPVSYVGPRVPPTLLVYGSRDYIVAPRFGRELDDRLREAGAKSVLLELPWADHAFDLVPNGLSAQIALYYTERFLAWATR